MCSIQWPIQWHSTWSLITTCMRELCWRCGSSGLFVIFSLVIFPSLSIWQTADNIVCVSLSVAGPSSKKTSYSYCRKRSLSCCVGFRIRVCFLAFGFCLVHSIELTTKYNPSPNTSSYTVLKRLPFFMSLYWSLYGGYLFGVSPIVISVDNNKIIICFKSKEYMYPCIWFLEKDRDIDTTEKYTNYINTKT